MPIVLRSEGTLRYGFRVPGYGSGRVWLREQGLCTHLSFGRVWERPQSHTLNVRLEPPQKIERAAPKP